MSLYNMVARFTDENILKVGLDPNDNTKIIVTTLDEDGDEVESTLDMKGYPEIEFTVTNNTASNETVGFNGLVDDRLTTKMIVIAPGETVKGKGIYGTMDGSTWITQLTILGSSTASLSNLVNCSQYGPYIVITDPSKDSSVTVSLT